MIAIALVIHDLTMHVCVLYLQNNTLSIKQNFQICAMNNSENGIQKMAIRTTDRAIQKSGTRRE